MALMSLGDLPGLGETLGVGNAGYVMTRLTAFMNRLAAAGTRRDKSWIADQFAIRFAGALGYVFGQLDEFAFVEVVVVVTVSTIYRRFLHCSRAVAVPQNFDLLKGQRGLDASPTVPLVRSVARIVATLEDGSQDGADSIIGAALHHPLMIAPSRCKLGLVRCFGLIFVRIVRAWWTRIHFPLFALRRISHDAFHCPTACASTIFLALRRMSAFRELAAAARHRLRQNFCHSVLGWNSALQVLHFFNFNFCCMRVTPYSSRRTIM